MGQINSPSELWAAHSSYKEAWVGIDYFLEWECNQHEMISSGANPMFPQWRVQEDIPHAKLSRWH